MEFRKETKDYYVAVRAERKKETFHKNGSLTNKMQFINIMSRSNKS